MNVNRISTSITSRITQLLKSGEVVQAVIKNGEVASFGTAPINKKNLDEIVTGLQKTKILLIPTESEPFRRVLDVYVVKAEKQNMLMKLIMNYQNRSMTFITDIINAAGEIEKKLVAKYKNIFILPKPPSQTIFNTFVEAYCDAPRVVITTFKKGKVQESYLQQNPANSTAAPIIKYYIQNGKITPYGKHVKENALRPKPDPIDFSMNSQKTTRAATIVKRPISNGQVIRLCLKNGCETQFETLNKSKKQFQNGMQDLVETREIYKLPFEDKTRSKVYDVFTLKNKNNKIKVIKDYWKQNVRLLWTKLDENGQIEQRTVFYMNPGDFLRNRKPSVNTYRELGEMVKNCKKFKITKFSDGKPISSEIKEQYSSQNKSTHLFDWT